MDEGPIEHDVAWEDHQLVELRFGSTASGELADTAKIRASLYYSECLSTFYREHPEWGYAGADGKPIFDEALTDGLCPDHDPAMVDCFVTGIRQDFYGDDQLVVDFDISGTLDDRILRLGPLPTPTLASCDQGQPAFVGHASLSGVGPSGENRWETSELSRIPADQDEPAPISVDAP